MDQLTVPRAVALYVGALLGPSLLLLPGLAATIAGPASIVAWGGLLVLSALLARVFAALGTKMPDVGGAAGYVRAALGQTAGKAAAGCFLAGVTLGAPIVCLIGADYVVAVTGGGNEARITDATLLLIAVLALVQAGGRAGSRIQLILFALLVTMVVTAVVTAAPHAHTANWTPFAPHGWTAVGSAASVLMMAFVGWEAIAPMTARLRDPQRTLPRVIAVTLAVTTVFYLGLAAATVAVLGDDAAGSVPLSRLLAVGLGPVGPAIAAAGAVVLTLAATNAYLSGARAMLRTPAHLPKAGLTQAVIVAGVVIIGGAAAGADTRLLVALPATFFLAVHLGCTAAAARLFTGRTRAAAAIACAAVVGVLGFCGWSLVPVAVVITVAGSFGAWRDRGTSCAPTGPWPRRSTGTSSARC